MYDIGTVVKFSIPYKLPAFGIDYGYIKGTIVAEDDAVDGDFIGYIIESSSFGTLIVADTDIYGAVDYYTKKGIEELRKEMKSDGVYHEYNDIDYHLLRNFYSLPTKTQEAVNSLINSLL